MGNFIKKWKEKRALDRIRIQLKSLGMDVDSLSDDELREGIAAFGRQATAAINKFALTAQQFVRAMALVGPPAIKRVKDAADGLGKVRDA